MIHQYKMDDLNIIIDVNSGSVHVFDDISYEYVKNLDKGITKEAACSEVSKKYPEADLEEVKQEVEELIDANVLFSEDAYEHVAEKFVQRKTVVKALCLHVAHDCNLKCTYCFAEEGEYHGKRELMSAEVGKAAIDYLIANSGQRHQLEVDFFGGEPLMNFGVVKEVVRYAESIQDDYNKKFRFTITTNGVLLNDQNMDFINEHMYNVVLSCDGRPEVHDHMRPTANNKGSYKLVMPKFKDFVEKRGDKSYYIRGTFTHNNLDFSRDVFHMADEGFNEISVEPVVESLDKDYALQKEDIPVVLKEYENLAMGLVKRRKENRDFNFFHFMVDLSGGPCVYKRLTGCGSGHEYMAVAPTGDLYPCHQFVGMDEFKMGHVKTGVENEALRSEFKTCNVYSKETCKSCWAKFYCSGGCSANAYNYNGSINAAYEMGCELEKKRVECAIFLKAKEMVSE